MAINSFYLFYEGQYYNDAANVLCGIENDFLFPQGEYQRILSTRSQLEIVEKELIEENVWKNQASLGSVYNHKGEYERAIEYFEKASRTAEKLHHLRGLSHIYASMAQCYSNLNNPAEGLKYFRKSLSISNDDNLNAKHICGIIAIYSFLGRYKKALEYTNKILNLSEYYEDDKVTKLSIDNNVGTLYSYLGKTKEAISKYERAKSLAEDSGQIGMRASILLNLAKSYTDLLSVEQATQSLNELLDISQKIQAEKLIAKCNVQLEILSAMSENWEKVQTSMNIGYNISRRNNFFDILSLSSMYLIFFFLKDEYVDLERALQYANTACNCQVPQHPEDVLLGIVYLRRRNVSGAVRKFDKAKRKAESLIKKHNENYQALEMKGLALAGLWLCDKQNGSYLEQSATAFKNARNVNKDLGVIKRLLLFRDAMKSIDQEGIPDSVWQVDNEYLN